MPKNFIRLFPFPLLDRIFLKEKLGSRVGLGILMTRHLMVKTRSFTEMLLVIRGETQKVSSNVKYRQTALN